jgi:hypothetical protein
MRFPKIYVTFPFGLIRGKICFGMTQKNYKVFGAFDDRTWR